MIRFKRDLIDEESEEIIWRKGYIYKVLYENPDHYIVDSDSINSEHPYGIGKEGLEDTYMMYPCNSVIMPSCDYCKFKLISNNQDYCGLKNIIKDERDVSKD